MQKQQIKRQYAKAAKKGGAKAAAEATRKTAKKTAEETRKAAAFAARHPAGILIAVAALLLFIMISAGLSSCGAMFSGLQTGCLALPTHPRTATLWQLKTTMPHWKTGCKVRLTISKAPTPAMMNTATTLTVSGITPTNLRLI